jgi:oxygen-independent coproporphyrinogen III oxidase
LYVHVPFCQHHCGYCDFAVTVGQNHLIDQYLDALSLEIARTPVNGPIETIFIGGGTPTLLSPKQLEQLCQMIRGHFPLSEPAELSIESTPESITADKIAVLADHGWNRVSVGVQSFDGPTLHVLDRQHAAAEVAPAIDAIRQRIANVSLDLIFGAPGQTEQSWKADLERAIQLQPVHISTYGLTYEKGTPLWKRREAGGVQPLSEMTELALYTHTHDRLITAGFEHYEISNFAQPGQRSRHNQKYWANEAYHGVGVGAVRYVGGSREHNRRNTVDYIKAVLSGESPTFQREELSPVERAEETLAVQLRRADGVDRSAFRQQTGHDVAEIVDDRLGHLIETGLIADAGTRFFLTFAGMCVADAVVSKLVWG